MTEQSLGFWAQIWALRAEIGVLLVQHALLAAAGIICGAAIAIPVGVFISRHPAWGEPLVQFCGMLYTVPSLALLGLLIPFLGLGWAPTIVALTIYSLLPLLRNTYIGIVSQSYYFTFGIVGKSPALYCPPLQSMVKYA